MIGRAWSTAGLLVAVALLAAACTAVDFTSMAREANQAGRYSEALTHAKEATATDPGYAPGWYWLGVTHYDLKQYDEAIRALERCVSLNPGPAQLQSAYYRMAQSRKRKEQYELAIPLFRRAIALKSDDFLAHHNLGHAYAETRQYELAIASYRRALEIDPVDRGGVTHFSLGETYYRNGNYAMAAEAFERARDLGDSDASKALENVRRAIAQKGPGPRIATSPPSPSPPPSAPPGPQVPTPGGPRQTRGTATGSGFLLKNTNLVLTNHHVIADRTDITVSLPSGESYPGRVVARDPGNDLALVQLQGRPAGAVGLMLAVNAEIRPGETVHAIGYPLGQSLSRQPSIVSGHISAAVGMGDDIARFRTTAPINPGNSGGPMLNERGQVIGIAAAGIVRQGVEAVRFGIKASTASLILQQSRVQTAFDIVATPATPRTMSPADIFAEASPHVVLIESR